MWCVKSAASALTILYETNTTYYDLTTRVCNAALSRTQHRLGAARFLSSEQLHVAHGGICTQPRWLISALLPGRSQRITHGKSPVSAATLIGNPALRFSGLITGGLQACMLQYDPKGDSRWPGDLQKAGTGFLLSHFVCATNLYSCHRTAHAARLSCDGYFGLLHMGSVSYLSRRGRLRAFLTFFSF